MLAQRLLVDLELIGEFGLGDAESRSSSDTILVRSLWAAAENKLMTVPFLIIEGK
jgi:hypothetical protein